MSTNIKEHNITINIFTYHNQLHQQKTKLNTEHHSHINNNKTPINPLKLYQNITNTITNNIIIIKNKKNIITQTSKIINVPQKNT